MTFTARAGRPDDYPLFVRLVAELDIEDPLPTPDQFAARMLPRLLVLEDGESATGYAWWQPFGATAHVTHVVVDPASRGRGAGRALLDAVRSRALAEGCKRWSLNVKHANRSAIRLYDRCGFAVDHDCWAMTTEWPCLMRLDGAPGTVPFVPIAEDDAELAATLDLDAARLAVMRARPGEVLVGLREGGKLVAFAAFDPAFPGIHPLRAARVELARPLFEALRPHAKVDRVVLVVDRDVELRDALVGVGARVLYGLHRMSGGLE